MELKPTFKVGGSMLLFNLFSSAFYQFILISYTHISHTLEKISEESNDDIVYPVCLLESLPYPEVGRVKQNKP